MNISRKRLIVASIITMSVLVLVIITNLKPAKTIERITLADASQPVFALVYIAESKGFFADEGLDITYHPFTSGRDALASVLAGESDMATVYETPVVLAAARGERLGIISTLHTSTSNTALLARNDHGITGVNDLKGKKIGVTKRTNAEYFLFLYLTSQGISLEDVSFIGLKPQEIAAALEKGRVDAVAAWNPYLFRAAETLPAGTLIRFNSDVYMEMSVLAGKQAFVSERKVALSRLIKALVRAEQFLQQHEQEALTLVIKRLKNQPEAVVRGVWKDFRATLKLNHALLSVLSGEANWFHEQGVTDNAEIDFSAMLYSDYLQAENPGAVTLVR